MEQLPHHYQVTATAEQDTWVNLSAQDVADITSAPPPQFGGPGDYWSPESLLVAAVADCFILTFKAIARASKLEWSELNCNVNGVLDKREGVTAFTEFQVSARLVLPAAGKDSTAERLLHKAEQACLITNSLSAATVLTTDVRVADE